ncbi:uncharacterized protein CTRU02_215434 [Colletotrichum truncatum]|uniref:Uncharacterized protein n=1 Tax=Colletotrichum truncatum TaxID=5467 RepID=A0ACC3YCJ0_COLTU
MPSTQMGALSPRSAQCPTTLKSSDGVTACSVLSFVTLIVISQHHSNDPSRVSRQPTPNMLKELPTGPDATTEAFDGIINRINESPSEQLAKDALRIIAFARGPLSAEELQHSMPSPWSWTL